MSGRYRDDKLDKFMDVSTELLSAIAGKELERLRVQEILKRDPEMSFDRATIIGMQEAANHATLRVAIIATSFDRTIRMATLMAQEMTTVGLKNGPIYERRLELLTDLDKITQELTPPKRAKGSNSYHAKKPDDDNFYDDLALISRG